MIKKAARIYREVVLKRHQLFCFLNQLILVVEWLPLRLWISVGELYQRGRLQHVL